MHPWNKVKIPEINSHTYGYFLTKEARIYNGAKNSLFNKWCWENWTATYRRMKLKDFLTPYTKINLKLIKDLNLKLLEENVDGTLFDINHKQYFFGSVS